MTPYFAGGAAAPVVGLQHSRQLVSTCNTQRFVQPHSILSNTQVQTMPPNATGRLACKAHQAGGTNACYVGVYALPYMTVCHEQITEREQGTYSPT